MNVLDEKRDVDKKEKKKARDKKSFSIRTINLKLNPTEEKKELIDKDIDSFSDFHDLAINRYAKLSDPKEMIEESKKIKAELKSSNCTGTFIDLAIGMRGAMSHFNTLRKMAKKDILYRDREIKKLEEENINLMKPKSVWFNKVKNVKGQCCMCGRKGNMPRQSNEYKDEFLCEVCSVEFFKYRTVLFPIKRHVMKNYNLCRDIASKKNLSEGLTKEIERFGKSVETFKRTISNKIKLKMGQLKLDFDKKMATITLQSGQKIQVEFLGDHYYTNFPKYGLDSDVNKYEKLIKDFLDGGGYPFLIRLNKNKNGEQYSEYYLSIPTHYPMKDKELNIEGCILVSQRRVLVYINGKAKFIELFNPYFKKRSYGKKQKIIQQENANLCICDWNKIPRKNRMLLLSLRDKLGYDWINENDVLVKKSEDGNITTVEHDDNIHKIVITLDRDIETAQLVSNDGSFHSLHIVESKKRPEEGKYKKTELYIKPQIPMPKKYSEGNLLKYIRHKNKEVARQIVEESKKLLSENGGVVVINYTGIHPEGKTVTPIISLNDQITNMLQYDSIYAGSIYWKRLKELICPNCYRVLPEKSENRYIIRDIFISEIKNWVCEDEICNRKINSPLIAVARHIMNSDIKELLKPPTRKETKEDDEQELTIQAINNTA